MRNRVTLKHGAWIHDSDWQIRFPEDWEIEVFMHASVKALEIEEIAAMIDSPVGSAGLEQLLHTGKRVLIVCDDISRPTRTDIILPLVTERLHRYGVRDNQITILIASGTHRPMNREEIARKLGAQVALNHRVVLHDYRHKGTYAGRTTSGTPVYLNSQFAKHDLVIGVGGICPHSSAGFGGGAKLILGACNIRTILHFHQERRGAGTGQTTRNEFRQDILEAARLAGMDFIVNSMVNQRREVTGVVSGDVEEAFLSGVDMARKLYGVPHPDAGKYDLVIADTYPFDATYAFVRKGWWPVLNVSGECHKLIIASMHEGKGGHLVYPIPRDGIINKIRRLWFELLAFGPLHFLSKSVTARFRSVFARIKPGVRKAVSESRTRKPEQTSESGYPGGDVDILHRATGSERESLRALPNRVFSDQEQYFQYLKAKTGNKPLKVALYRASSLTYPQNPPDT